MNENFSETGGHVLSLICTKKFLIMPVCSQIEYCGARCYYHLYVPVNLQELVQKRLSKADYKTSKRRLVHVFIYFLLFRHVYYIP